MNVTVLIEYDESRQKKGIVATFEGTILPIYEAMVADKDNDCRDMSIIFRVNGSDIAARCPRTHEEDDIDLF
jgi:hypothetical protein